MGNIPKRCGQPAERKRSVSNCQDFPAVMECRILLSLRDTQPKLTHLMLVLLLQRVQNYN